MSFNHLTLADKLAQQFAFVRPKHTLDSLAYTRWWEHELWFKEVLGRWSKRKVSPRYKYPWNISTSGESRFVQNGYSKKEKNQNKEDWRKRKGFARDQGKNSCWCKLGPYLKDVDHRSRRAYEREMINLGLWDEMYNHKEMFVSSWDAC